MPDQLFTYSIENPLVTISINSGRKARKVVGGWGKWYGSFWG
jgi:hypothetical protein